MKSGSNTNVPLEVREQNDHAFVVDDVFGKRVVIVDDVYTSGDTALSLAAAVKRAGGQAVMVATRRVASLACFQSPSCTVDFRPSRFVPVDGFLETKLEMLAAFSSQSHRDYMEPDAVRSTARYWSRFGGGTDVEPLEIVRETSDLSTPNRDRTSARHSRGART